VSNEKRRRGCLQFSLRTVLVVMTIAALLCGALFAAPAIVGFLLTGFVLTAMPLVLTIMLIYGRGYLRTFAIGALFPGVIVMLYSYAAFASVLDDLDDALETSWEAGLTMVIYTAFAAFVLALYGGTAMLVRWFIERPRREQPVPAQAEPESPFDAECDNE